MLIMKCLTSFFSSIKVYLLSFSLKTDSSLITIVIGCDSGQAIQYFHSIVRCKPTSDHYLVKKLLLFYFQIRKGRKPRDVCHVTEVRKKYVLLPLIRHAAGGDEYGTLSVQWCPLFDHPIRGVPLGANMLSCTCSLIKRGFVVSRGHAV